jgi:Lamin Tail Domain
MIRHASRVVLTLAVVLAGCAAGESAEENNGGKQDAGDAASESAPPDTGPQDAPDDATQDAEPDVESDALEDGAAEAEADAADAEPEAGCPNDTKDCGGECVDVDDPSYGCTDTGCDPCELDNATAACDGNGCSIDACDAGFADCDNLPANGCEVDLLADPDHCGLCGHDCVVPNGTPGCDNGSCTIAACDTGFDNCDPSIVNGCEANLQLDPSHCGQCGALCQPVGSSACINGECQTTGCDPGAGDCDNLPDNGCEVDLTSDVTNCGYCGNACVLTHATAACASSQCVVEACDPGFDDCDGVNANGCEADIASSVGDCGGCNAPCSNLNNLSRACTSGVCSYVCNSGFADCNGPQAGHIDDGCETVISADVNNCGGCGVSCQAQNGSNPCVNSVCTPQCSIGFGNCDGNPINGCETATSVDIANCGACGTVCAQIHASNACVSGVCVPTCASGYADCDGNPNNGCETPTTSVNNCGGCGVTCLAQNGTTSCVSGTCTPICTTGYGDCDGSPSNGCETQTSVSPDHCGACGNACAVAHTQTSCVSGTCAVVSCDAYYFDNNKNAADGCEYRCDFVTPTSEVCDDADNDCDGQVDEDFDKQSDPNNCGTCGTTCGTSTGGLCCSGTCRSSDPSNCGACGRSCVAGMLVINELLANPDAVDDSQGEWFEIYNPNTFDVDLRGFQIKDDDVDTHFISSNLPVVVPAGGYLVLGNNASMAINGGAPVGYQYGTFSLGNGSDELDIVAYGVLLDRITWISSFAAGGVSKELSVNHRTAAQNDSASNWCSAVSPFGAGDLGTPGLPNVCSL